MILGEGGRRVSMEGGIVFSTSLRIYFLEEIEEIEEVVRGVT